MDERKAEVLREVGYRIKESCGLCTHAILSDDGWGECTKHTYSHQKHSGPVRNLSITRYGWCPLFQTDLGLMAQLHGFQEFIS